MEHEITPLSASRVKVAEGCSWLYWCKYKLKLPELSNDGAKRGTICHLLLEVLGDKRRRAYLKKIKSTQNIFTIPSVERLMMKHAKVLGVDDEENVELMKQMTFNGLSYDFLGTTIGRPTKAISEKEFDITIDDGEFKFRVRGFIDKLFLYKKHKFALIRDFKTSKSVFVEKEIEDNLQNLVYSFASQHLFPEYINTQSEFLFLKFPLEQDHEQSGIVAMEPLTAEELEGFKHQLTKIQKYIDNFSERSARNNMASRKDFPKDKTFSGRLLCGFAKEKGELKIDGNPKWHCPMKFDFFYCHIYNKDGIIVGRCFEEEFKESMIPEGGRHELKYYAGCPSFNR